MANTKVTTGVIADDAITSAKIDSTSTGMTFADLTVTGEITANGGINVTGTVTSDGLTVDGTGTLSTIGNGTQQIRTYVDADEVSLLTDGSARLDLWTGGNKTMRLDANGDISFYEDTGTTAKLFWDASAESLTLRNGGSEGILNVGGSTSSIVARFTDATTSSVVMRPETGGAIIGSDGGGALHLAANGSTLSDRKMTILPAGNVGIGTTSPSTPLHIKSDSEYQLKIEATASAGASMQLYSAGTYAYTVYENSSANFRVGAYGGSSFIIRDQGNSADRLTINSSGNATFTGTITSGAITSSSNITADSTNAYILVNRSATNRRSALVFTTNASDVNAQPPATATIDYALGVTDSDEVSGNKFFIKAGDTNASSSQFFLDSSGATFSGTISATGAISSSSNISSTLDLISNQDFYLSRAAGTSPAFLITNHEFFRFITDTAGNYNQCILGVNSTNNLYTNNAFVSTSGVYIGGTAAANLLDDYEEGTHAATLNMTSGSVTYYNTAGKYVKVGNQVTYNAWIQINTPSSPSGALNITLPFAIASTVTRPAAMMMSNNLTGVTGTIGGWINPSTATMYLTIINNGSSSSLDGSNLAANAELYITITYNI